MAYQRLGKRIVDVAAAGVVLVVIWPLLALLWLLIRLTSRGPAFYVQERIGKAGAPFPFIKFRTMVIGADALGAGVLCLRNDPRVTRVGRILRRLSLDELPQLFNVLRGEMSLVGPRPGLAYQVQEYTPFQRRRLTVLPGITGWAQVNGRNSITWARRIELDVEYVERMSLLLDLQILCRTCSAVLARGDQIAERDYFKELRQSHEPQ